MLGLAWTYTQVGCTYSWREVCVRFRMDLRPGRGALIHGEKFVLGLGWTSTQSGALIYGGKFVLGLGWTYAQGGGLLFMERSLC